jgi:hypothetical protein
MQGYVDMTRYPEWNSPEKRLTGTSRVVGGETYKVVLALNGFNVAGADARGAKISIKVTDPKTGLATLSIDSPDNTEVDWEVRFE